MSKIASLNYEVYAQVCADLGIDEVPIFFLPNPVVDEDSPVESLGIYYHGSWIDIYPMLHDSIEQLVESILHELRHAHQWMTWNPKRFQRCSDRAYRHYKRGNVLAYRFVAHERDARRFARKNRDRYSNLITVVDNDA